MTPFGCTVKFQKTLLVSLIGLCINQSCLALEELSDESLSASTGEGIALLPEDFSMRFNGIDNTAGAGSIRLIPVGPSSATMEGKGFQKADIFLNGLSIGQSKKAYGAARSVDDWDTPFGQIGTGANDFGRTIDSWGTVENPWILKTVTQKNVPGFDGVAKDVAYLDFEAPLMHSTIPTTGTGTSAYNLKLGLWADAFMRDKTIAESVSDKMLGLSNRLRLAVVWDGFSINGSSIKLFRTLGGVPANGDTMTNGHKTWGTYTANLKINNVLTDKTFNFGPRPAYNETLGLAGVVRLNSGVLPKANNAAVDSSIYQAGAVTRKIVALKYVERNADGSPKYTESTDVTATPNGQEELYTTYTPQVNNNFPGNFTSGGACTTPMSNSGGNGGGNGQVGQCLTQEGVTARRFKATATNSWTAPVAKSVFRISTQELTGAATDNKTPALGGVMPSFKANNTSEGIFLYNPNINLVLGSLQQPLIFNTEKSTTGGGSNFSLEITRIPDNVNVYSKIYQRYNEIDPVATVDPSITYLGNTCTIAKCGGTLSLGGVSYQDSKATHSSISIGTSQLDANGRLVAYKGIDAYGISFGALKTTSGLTSSLEVDYTKVWQQTRSVDGCGFLGLGTCKWLAYGAWSAKPIKNPITGAPHPSLNNPNPYETTFRQNQSGQIYGVQTTLPTTNPSATILLNSMQPPGASPLNNMGSAVIDGLLIQHFKFTTTGL